MSSEKHTISIPKEKLVTVYFKTGAAVEGVVVSWKIEYAILRAKGGANQIVIYNPSENVLMVKVVSDVSTVPAPIPSQSVEESDDEDEEEEMSEPEVPRTWNGRHKKVVEKQIKQGKKEKRALSNRLRAAPKNVAPQGTRYEAPWEGKL